jgi:hypothetical protein
MEEIKPGYWRVTEVLKRYVDFSNIDPVVLAKAAERGTRVHGFCSLYARGVPTPFVDEDCQGYVESFKRWFDKYVDKVHVNEDRFYCDGLMITGAIDLVVSIKNDEKLCIVDLKTPATISKSWRLQTSAYEYLYNRNNDNEANRRAVLQIKKDGKPAVFHEHDDPNDWKTYLGILRAERYFQ